MNKIKSVLAIILLSIVVFSCSSDDSDKGNKDSSCNEFINQTAQGTFKGVDFTSTGGSYRFQFEEYFCAIYVSEITEGDCAFPRFGGNEAVILFSLADLNAQTIALSDVIGEGESLNFNSIEGVTTLVEQAECGKIEILSSTSTTVSGRIVANGQDGSSINGNFTLTLCEE